MSKPIQHIYGIDPGPTETAWVKATTDRKILDHGFQPNDEVLGLLTVAFTDWSFGPMPKPIVVCEMVESFGMTVGKTIFETVLWIGRFEQKAFDLSLPFHRLFRRQVKMHLCGNNGAKDANIRQALIDKLGDKGTAAEPGPTRGISGHVWAALAVAVTFIETQQIAKQQPQLV
jgi:hypothetical protein